MRYLAYALLLLLYLLHTDVWYWDDARIVLGLPIGITYHVLWTLAVSVCFWLAVRHAWPDQLEWRAGNGSAPSDRTDGPATEARSTAP